MLKKPGFKAIFVLEFLIRQANMHEIVQQIRADLRRSMNGVISKSMREKGLSYKLNFGVDIPRLRELSKRYPADTQLVELLWKQETRELKILATLLCPVDEFTIEKAEKWVKEISNHEIREQICMNLFQKLSFADKLVENWTNSTDEEIRTSGYWLFARLLIVKSDLVKDIDSNILLDKMISDLSSDSYFLRLSAQNALKFLGRTSKELSQKILTGIQDFQTSDNTVKNEIFESLSFEFTDYLD
ncbi:MAG: DNA alkylation repair protein [Bacteroidia bacterium]|nr:DNA alkylation repair protein [Bacteroidia bacterium]